MPGDLGVTIRIGPRYPRTWGAHGRALVAALPGGQRAEALATEVWFDGRAKVLGHEERSTDEAELDRVRRTGYGCDRGRVHRGVRTVSAAIPGPGEEPAACVVVMGTFGPGDDGAIGEQVQQAARTFTDRLGPILARSSRCPP